MASNTVKPSIYDRCAGKRKLEFDYNVDDSIIKDIGLNFRVLPTFEKSMFEHVFLKYCSLQRNEKLKCYWQTYKRNLESRVFAPFQFPDVGDLHIGQNVIRFLPNENRFKLNNRFRLKPGPGTDDVGQRPIPHELHYKRSCNNLSKGHNVKKVKRVARTNIKIE